MAEDKKLFSNKDNRDSTVASPAQAGFVAYASLAAVGRIGKDSTMCPSVHQSLRLATMMGRACEAIENLENWAKQHDEELPGLVSAFYGNVNDLESRLRPGDWWERLVKSYITIGLFADLAAEVGAGTDLVQCAPAMTDYGYAEFAQPLLLAHVQDDEAEAARLSLWGRRVFGETLGLTREGLTLRLELGLQGTNKFLEVTHELSDKHAQRMEAAGLAA